MNDTPVVMVVEDDAIIALQLQNSLTRMGYNVCGLVSSGEESITQASALKPDIVLMDIRLRGDMTGIEAAEEIQKTLSIPIIYLTAYTDESLIDQSKDTGPYGYLVKPVREKELRASIEIALYKSKTDRKLKHLNEVLRAIRDINQLITKERNPDRLLQEACSILVRTRSFLLVWIGQSAGDGGDIVPVVAAGQIDIDKINASGCLALRRARESGTPVFCNCYEAEGERCSSPYKAAVLGQGGESTFLLPLVYDKRFYGLLVASEEQGHIHDSEEQQFLNELAGDIAYALFSIEEENFRKEAEEKLFESEERYRIAIESSNDGVALLRNGMHIYANRSFLNIFGYDSDDEIIGKSVARIVHPDYVDFVLDHLEEHVQETSASGTYEFLGIKKDGMQVHVEVSGARVLFHGNPLVLVYVRDITFRKKLEEQFRQAQRMEAIGKFASGIAHDFNNILSTIAGHAELMKMTLDGRDPLTDHITEILLSTERATILTKGILAFGRGKTSNMELVDVNAIVAEIENFLRRLIGEKITLTVALSSEVLCIEADKNQIQQVIMNLVANSRDAIEKEGTLAIGTALVRDKKVLEDLDKTTGVADYTVINISDTGCGIDEETRTHIFEPFYSTKETGANSGLGLSIAYNIVRQHNGIIKCQSEVGQGTTFEIYLPLSTTPMPTAPRAVQAEELPRGHETILIAEDDENARSMLGNVLSTFGYRVFLAANGNEAREIVMRKTKEISLAILDVIMPKGGGKELSNDLRSIKPSLKVLFMSGYSVENLYEKGVIDRTSLFIPKPVSFTDLIKKVRTILDGPEQGDVNETPDLPIS